MSRESPDAPAPKHAVIVSHPEPDSFTMAVAQAYCRAVEARGQTAVLRDLYRMNFDPVLKGKERPGRRDFAPAPAPDVKAELKLLAGAGAFVLVYPIWFGTPPAMIKGYVERVFGAGYEIEAISRPLDRSSHKLLGGRQLLSFSSSGASRQWLEDQGAWLSLQTIFDGYLARAFWMSTPDHLHFDNVHDGMSEKVARDHLVEVGLRAEAMCDTLATAAPINVPASAH